MKMNMIFLSLLSSHFLFGKNRVLEIKFVAKNFLPSLILSVKNDEIYEISRHC